ncbi:hypothetical protein AKJ16_DCAP21322 [Drosera capensis]
MGATMGAEERDGGGESGRLSRSKKCIACFVSFFVSLIGGLLLIYWEMVYHPKNSQLWMVPFGLILFATPVIVAFNVIASDLLGSSKEGGLPVFCRGGLGNHEGKDGCSGGEAVELGSKVVENGH